MNQMLQNLMNDPNAQERIAQMNAETGQNFQLPQQPVQTQADMMTQAPQMSPVAPPGGQVPQMSPVSEPGGDVDFLAKMLKGAEESLGKQSDISKSTPTPVNLGDYGPKAPTLQMQRGGGGAIPIATVDMSTRIPQGGKGRGNMLMQALKFMGG